MDQAYDLWKHNCNNFSNDFATFLLGKGIPDHIINMPKAVLESPLGRMLLPALNQQINASKRGGSVLGIQETSAGSSVKPMSQLHHHGAVVRNITDQRELDSLLAAAEKSCAAIFFTSATCPPCKILYPLYDQLAAEIGNKGVLIKVDVSQAYAIGRKYSISATPTFITFLQGKQEKRWSGADGGALRGNIQLLVQMAWPLHPHQNLNLPTISNPYAKPVLFTKVPPLSKLLAKMGPAGEDASVQGMRRFLELRSKEGAAEASLPDVSSFTNFVRDSTQKLPVDLIFTVVDLLRCSLIDARVSGILAEEKDHQTVRSVLKYVNGLVECPYALRLVSLQMACNLFSSTLYPDQVLGHDELRAAVTQLISTSFLDDSHSNVRVAAASLLFNVALANSTKRREGPGDVLPEGDQIELAASTLEAISQEESSPEALQGMLLALGYLIYLLPPNGELSDLLRTMDAEDTVLAKKKHFPDMTLIDEVGSQLLREGLKRP